MCSISSRGTVTQLNRLLSQRKGAGNQRLRRDDRSHRCQPDEGEQSPGRCKEEKRLLGGRWIRQQKCALAEVIQEQRGEDKREPRKADGALSEVTHVGVERLTSGNDEKDGTEDGESVPAVFAKE